MKSIFRIIAPVGAVLAASALFVTGASADTNDNTNASSQTSTTTQNSAAISGNATASGFGSYAESGNALSVAASQTNQASVQLAANQAAAVVVGGNNTNTNVNASAQTATTMQGSAAVSGDATASGIGSEAYSGWAASIVVSETNQLNFQLGANQVFFFGP
jgi:hypothetical protein